MKHRLLFDVLSDNALLQGHVVIISRIRLTKCLPTRDVKEESERVNGLLWQDASLSSSTHLSYA